MSWSAWDVKELSQLGSDATVHHADVYNLIQQQKLEQTFGEDPEKTPREDVHAFIEKHWLAWLKDAVDFVAAVDGEAARRKKAVES
jgi:hypothetical protein